MIAAFQRSTRLQPNNSYRSLLYSAARAGRLIRRRSDNQTHQSKVCSRGTLGHKRCVCTLLHDNSFVKHSDQVTILDSAEPVCHYYTSPADHNSVQCRLHYFFRLTVQCTCSFIQ